MAEQWQSIRQAQGLADVIKLILELRRSDAPPDSTVWTVFLPGGDRHHVYKAAGPARQAAWIDLIDGDETSLLVPPLGELLLEATDSDLVRRSITEALVRLGDPEATEYLNQRLRLMSAMEEMTDALRAERIRLVRAKKALRP